MNNEILTDPDYLQGSGLSARARNILHDARIKTVGELISYDPRTLKKFRNCGRKTISEIEEFLRGLELELKESPDSTEVLGLRFKIREYQDELRRLYNRIGQLESELYALRKEKLT